MLGWACTLRLLPFPTRRACTESCEDKDKERQEKQEALEVLRVFVMKKKMTNKPIRKMK